MPGVSYALADFVTGGPILDLPVRKGASWSAQMGRPDALSCSINMRAAEARGLDLKAATEPNKTIVIARTDDDVVLAWGVIGDDSRVWDDDSSTLELTIDGVEDSWLGKNPIGPATALTAALTVKGSDGFSVPNPALDTNLSGLSHGSIGKRLVQQLLTWPGAPVIFDLPADQVGTRQESYAFASLKSVGSALSDLTAQEDGPDFAFRAQRASDGLGLRVVMTHGTEANPRLGSYAGVWKLGGPSSPIRGLKLTDAVAGGSFAGFMSGGKQSGDIIMSRVVDLTRLANGYPPLSIIDTSRSDVSVQATLDSYNRANLADSSAPIRDLEFTVRGDASPGLGNYRPGDTVDIDVPTDHKWLTPGVSLPIRIMSMSGDETGKNIKIGCVILDD